MFPLTGPARSSHPCETPTAVPGSTSHGRATLRQRMCPVSHALYVAAKLAWHHNSANITFTLTAPTSNGTLIIPQKTGGVALDGRQSKVIITDYTFGAHGSVLYTTASVFFAGTIGNRDVLFLYGAASLSHEIALTFSGTGSPAPSSRIQFDGGATHASSTIVSILPGDTGLVTIWDSDTQLVLFADPVTAATFWAPTVRSPTSHTVAGLENFFQFGTNTTVLVCGTYLVRNATLERGTLALRGDLNASVPLTVYAPDAVRAVT